MWMALSILAARAEAQSQPDRLRVAVEDLHATDANGQWFSFTLAAAGALPGLVLGGITVVDGGLLGLDAADGFARGAGIGMLATGGGLLAHGLMRVDERQASAETTAMLLGDAGLLQASGEVYLRDRAQKAHATRLLGGVLTLLHGASTGLLGVAALVDDARSDALGYALVPLGAIGMAVGAVHFFGETHPERLLHAVRGERTARSLRLTPSLAFGSSSSVQSSLALRGRF
jgi:hypothetical protein